MAGIDKLRTNSYIDYNMLRLWCIEHKPHFLYKICDPFMSYIEWEQLQKGLSKNTDYSDDVKLIIAIFYITKIDTSIGIVHCILSENILKHNVDIRKLIGLLNFFGSFDYEICRF